MLGANRLQHAQFQMYLKKQKSTVSENLKKKIFPSGQIEDYNLLEILGQGSYGLVVAAENINSKKTFAIKIIKKKILVKGERLKHLMSEIRILSSVKFQFLINLECYFTNRCAVFIVLPYIRGEHFFNLLRTFRRFDEKTARFFAGQVILAIEYLHYMDIVYRDLKPENLLLDLEGYLKLVDYGFAKVIGHSYSYSFCGTPEYLAPEILLNKGHTYSPDWWTLGILIYEMCSGSPPFTSRNEMTLFEKILQGNIKWPSYFSEDLRSLVQGLLQVDRTKRLGCKKDKAGEVKFHKWFATVNWTALWNKKVSPPITIPKIEAQGRRNSKLVEDSIVNCTNIIPPDMIGNIDSVI